MDGLVGSGRRVLDDLRVLDVVVVGVVPVGLGRGVVVLDQLGLDELRLELILLGHRSGGSGSGRHEDVLGLVARRDQVQPATDDARQRNPLVPAQTAELVGRIDAQTFDPEADDAVAEHVHGEEPATGRVEALVDPEQESAQREVAERLVEERRMERRPRRVAGVERRLVVDLQRPRQVGGRAEQLLVEVVAPTANGLGQVATQGRRRSPLGRAGGPDAG